MPTSGALAVRPVASRRDLGAFVDLPFRLHGDQPHWIPPLKLERKLFLSRKQNPYFEHGTAEYFLAERDGVVVGRITAQIDPLFNDFQDNTWGNFGFLEFEDDADVLEALLTAAGDWLRERGRERMVGPMGFALNDEPGILIDGFDIDPMFQQPWHPPYYQQRIEEAGLTKAMDLLMWKLTIDDREKVHPGIFAAAKTATDEHGLKLVKMSRRSVGKDIRVDFHRLFNAAWARNWGFRPYSARDLKVMGQEIQLVFSRHWFMKAVDPQGKTVGMAITIPDLNQALRAANGRLFPFGLVRLLIARAKIDQIRVGWLGIEPDMQHTGAAALLYVEHFENARHLRQDKGEMGWILETNKPMNWAMQGMGGEVVKRYRMYDRPLMDGVESLPLPVAWDAPAATA
ncbi:MAG: hypothetical protein AAGC46_05575 [Solirubrobacteraceae bacterium]|nr:hypothetical protein [Patulibacter sp.]